MNIALVNPPSSFLIDQAVHPPLGLWYLGAVLKRSGYNVQYADMGLGDSLPKDADVYGVTGTTPQLSHVKSVIGEIKTRGKPVVAGGPHATVLPASMIVAGATAVVQGEGEEALLRVLEIPDLKAVVNITARRIVDLDALPFPDRSQCRRYRYWITDRVGRKHEATTIISSRGCPNRCAFCSHAVWGKLYRERSADNVLAELRELKSLGYDAVHFFDDSLCINKRRLKALCEGIKRLGMWWRCFVRADQVTPEILEAMSEAGCVEVGLGVESGSQKVLAAINKGETVAQQQEAIGWAQKAGIRVKAFLIVGLPGEDWESIDSTQRLLQSSCPDDIDVSVLQLMPGSPLYENPQAFGLTVTDGPMWYKGRKGEYVCNHRTQRLSSDDLLVARDYLESRFKCA